MKMKMNYQKKIHNNLSDNIDLKNNDSTETDPNDTANLNEKESELFDDIEENLNELKDYVDKASSTKDNKKIEKGNLPGKSSILNPNPKPQKKKN